MKKYLVNIVESSVYSVEVLAESEQEAREIAVDEPRSKWLEDTNAYELHAGDVELIKENN